MRVVSLIDETSSYLFLLESHPYRLSIMLLIILCIYHCCCQHTSKICAYICTVDISKSSTQVQHVYLINISNKIVDRQKLP